MYIQKYQKYVYTKLPSSEGMGFAYNTTNVLKMETT